MSGAETNTKGISYDVDSDGALEEIRLGYGTDEDGTINAALCIDNVEKVQGLPDGMEESSLKLELLKLPNGCLLIHAYGYCGESIGGGLDRLFKVKAVDGATDPEFAHSVTTVLDCYGNPYIMKGKGVTHANAGLAYVIGDDIVVQVFEQGGAIRVAVKAPRELPILRGEVHERDGDRPDGLLRQRPKTPSERVRNARRMEELARKKETAAE